MDTFQTFQQPWWPRGTECEGREGSGRGADWTCGKEQTSCSLAVSVLGPGTHEEQTFLSLMGDSAFNCTVAQKALQFLSRPPWLPETSAVSQGQRLIFLGAGLPRVFTGIFGTGFGFSQR